MDIEMDVPGGRGRHGRLRLPRSWPALEDLVDLADGLAMVARLCPDCDNVRPEDMLLAMAEIAPADLAAGLRERAGVKPEPDPAVRALAETYERYADELAAVEAVRRGGAGVSARGSGRERGVLGDGTNSHVARSGVESDSGARREAEPGRSG